MLYLAASPRHLVGLVKDSTLHSSLRYLQIPTPMIFNLYIF
jgi:hypothetical protein